MHKAKHPFMYHFVGFGGKIEEILKKRFCFKWHIRYIRTDLFDSNL